MEIFNVDEYIKIRDEKQTNEFVFEELEINISRKCNRKCCICPHSNPNYEEINNNFKQFMDFELFSKIVEEIKTFKHKFNIDIIGNGEPTLHPNFFEIVKKIKEVNQFIRITTNGDNFKNKTFLENYFNLVNDNINTYISIYNPKDYDFFLKIKEKFKQHNIHLKDMYIENFDLKTTLQNKYINNRGGMVEIETQIKNKSCNYPFYSIYIDTNGDFQYCPHSWCKDLVINNFNNISISEFWFSDSKQRKLFIDNKRSELFPCNICNVDGMKLANKKRSLYIKMFKKKGN